MCSSDWSSDVFSSDLTKKFGRAMITVSNEVARPEIGKSLVVDGSLTNYHDVGEGAPVLLIHGSGPGVTAWANWRLNIPELAKRFRVIAPDMFGFGYSDSKGRIEDQQNTEERSVGKEW